MKIKSAFYIIGLAFTFTQCNSNSYRTQNIPTPTEEIENKIKNIYKDAKLKEYLSFDIFRIAMVGFFNIEQLNHSDKIMIIDFSKPSTKERGFVINLDSRKLLYKCLVAHGKNSGGKIPSNFSNTPNSKQSSLGFFLTAETYNGKHGFSARLDGIEKDINHNARKRAIVIHGADYVSHKYIKENGRLGRSWGCPALPTEISEEIIKSISNGRCLFIYANNSEYIKKSKYTIKN